MSEVRIRLRQSGPLIVEGPVTLVDHEGNVFALPPGKPNLALCRCGASQNRPFCDGSHKSCGFAADELAPPANDE